MAVELTWYGHAAWGVRGGGANLLIDPFLSDNPQAPVSPDQVEADHILISHGHGDHVGDAVAIAKRTGAQVIANFEIVSWFESQHGIQGHPLHLGGGYDFPFGRVQLTLAFHGSTMPDGSAGGNPAGFLIKLEGKTLYDAADTGLFYDMKLIGDRHHPDVALLPIGDNFTMGPDDALYAVQLIRPGLVIPMHYDTFPWIRQDVEAWAHRVREETDAECRVLQPGETLTVP